VVAATDRARARRGASIPGPASKPRAAVSNAARAVPDRFSASASSRVVSRRAVLLMPLSRSLMDRGLTPALSANVSCVSLASVRRRLSSSAKLAGCSVTPRPSPPHLLLHVPRSTATRDRLLIRVYADVLRRKFLDTATSALTAGFGAGPTADGVTGADHVGTFAKCCVVSTTTRRHGGINTEGRWMGCSTSFSFSQP